MRSETVGRAMFLALFGLSIYLMYRIFLPFLPGIAWAIMLVVVFQPVYQKMVVWLHGRALLAAIILSLAVGAFLVLPTLFAVVHLARGVVSAYGWLSTELAAGRSPLDMLREVPALREALESVERWVDVSQLDMRGMALNSLQRAGNYLAGQTRSLVANVFQTLLTMIVLLVTMVVLLVQWPTLLAAVERLLPLPEADKREVIARLNAATRAIFYGVLLTALVQGILGGIGCAIAGLPVPVVFGAAIFFAAMLPAGPALVWIPAAGYLLATGRVGWGVFLLAWGALVVGTVDNVLRPVFIGRGLRMHMLLVFFGTFGGMFAFGLIGLFTGPLIITFFLFLLDVAKRDLLRPIPSEPTVPPAAPSA